MWDEDADHATTCPHCGERDECEHLFAVLERSFGECAGGYACERYVELVDAVEEAFARALARDDPQETDWDTEDLRALWDHARESLDPRSGRFEIEPAILARVVVDLFRDAGADEADAALAGDDVAYLDAGPAVFHAQDPNTAFDRALAILTVLLRQD